MAIDNDTRGWIMTVVSGIACVIGASIICIDIVVRRFPHMQDFSIAESDAFLSASLSLSFGVMLFSSLYSMLPQAKTYLTDAGHSPRTASFLLIGLFLAGVLGIRVISNVMHHFMPSHVVDCDHTHDEEDAAKGGPGEMSEQLHEHTDTNASKPVNHMIQENDENTPLLSRTLTDPPPNLRQASLPAALGRQENGYLSVSGSRRSSGIKRTLTKTYTKFLQGQKENCDESGPCMGFTDPCGQDCFRFVQWRSSGGPQQGTFSRSSTFGRAVANDFRFNHSTSQDDIEAAENTESYPPHDQRRSSDVAVSQQSKAPARSRATTHHYHHPEHDQDINKQARRSSSHAQPPSAGQEHHHHVPTNAFMSIGLQTSIAIALHKAPEGFITYATNHANPTLGFAVFMALFIHNITEGFAMSLPLYLALKSRLKAIIWSSFLGGISQPIGAGVAALWFKVAQKSGHGAPDEGIYGGMFAITAGVMTSVALSLFSESLQLSHNRGMCILFAFSGMGILGVSFALTAK